MRVRFANTHAFASVAGSLHARECVNVHGPAQQIRTPNKMHCQDNDIINVSEIHSHTHVACCVHTPAVGVGECAELYTRAQRASFCAIFMCMDTHAHELDARAPATVQQSRRSSRTYLICVCLCVCFSAVCICVVQFKERAHSSQYGC